MTIAAFSPDVLEQACQLLADGDVVAIPTETVYGLAADATNDQAIARIYAVKQRPQFNPLIIHCHSTQQAKQYVEFDARAEKLAAKLWPGPITFVLNRLADSGISLLASSGLDTLAVRIPAHPVAQALIKAYGKPLAAPSANMSQTLSPTSALHVQASLGNQISLIIDGGQTKVGIESTIIDLTQDIPTILRPGGVSREKIQEIIGPVHLGGHGVIKAPGMMDRHYAPTAKIRLNALDRLEDEVLLGFGAVDCDLNLSSSGNLEEAAANLFKMIRELDRPDVKGIAVSPIPNFGLGLAINDRLQRAASPA